MIKFTIHYRLQSRIKLQSSQMQNLSNISRFKRNSQINKINKFAFKTTQINIVPRYLLLSTVYFTLSSIADKVSLSELFRDNFREPRFLVVNL